jgi:hypothetical protein
MGLLTHGVEQRLHAVDRCRVAGRHDAELPGRCDVGSSEHGRRDIGNVAGVVGGHQFVNAIERDGSHVDGHHRRASMSQQIAVDEHLAQRGIVRQHRNDGVAPHGICRVRGNLGAGTFELAQRPGRLVPRPHAVSGLEQVRRHGPAHPAGAEKSDIHRCHPLPPGCRRHP